MSPMPVRIDKTIHVVENNEYVYLGTIRGQGRTNDLLVERGDYRLHADRKPFLFLRIDEEDGKEEDIQNDSHKKTKKFYLSWDTVCSPKDFYVPSFCFHEAVHAALGGKEEGSVRVQEWGKNILRNEYPLQEYLQVQGSMQHFLDNGFKQKQGVVSINTNQYTLLLGHYSIRKRITASASEDLSDALGPLIRATSCFPFTEEDDIRLTAAITYFLNETIFEETHH